MDYCAVIVLLLAAVLQTTVSTDVLWVSDEDSSESSYEIKYIALPDGEAMTFDLDKTNLPSAGHIAFDSTRDVLYIVSDDGYLARVPEDDPSDVTVLPATGTTASYGPRGVAVDEITGTVYYTDYEDNEIVAVSYNSASYTTTSTVVHTDAGSLRDIAVDYNVGLMFWVDYTPNKIQCSGLDGSGVGTVHTSGPGSSQLQGIGTDLDDHYLYWCDHNAHTLSRAQYSAASGCSPAGGFTVEVVHTFPEDVSCRDVAIGADTLYFSLFDETQEDRLSAVYSVPKSALTAGGTIADTDIDLGFVTRFPMSLALKRDNPPVIETACTQPDTCTADQMCVIIPAGHRCVCRDGAENCQDGVAVVRDSETEDTTIDPLPDTTAAQAGRRNEEGNGNSAVALTLPRVLVTLQAVVMVLLLWD